MKRKGSPPPFSIKHELDAIFAMAPRPRRDYTLRLVVDAVLAEPRHIPEFNEPARRHMQNTADRRSERRKVADTLADPEARFRASAYAKWHAHVVEILVTDGTRLLLEAFKDPDETPRFEDLAARLDYSIQAFRALECPWWPDYGEIEDRPESVVQYARRILNELETQQIKGLARQ